MADPTDPIETKTHNASVALQVGLKSCHKVVDSYREKLGQQPGAAPPAETIVSTTTQE